MDVLTQEGEAHFDEPCGEGDILHSGVICFAGEDWWYHNRGHYDMQVMRRIAHHVPVLFVNSVVMQRPKLNQGRSLLRKIRRKLGSIARGLRWIENKFYVYSPLSIPFHGSVAGRCVNWVTLSLQVRAASAWLGLHRPIVWVECPAACDVALSLPRGALVYQRTDRHEEFRSEQGEFLDPQVARYDQRLRRLSNLTVYVSKALFEEERHSAANAFLSDHGVDFDRFAHALDPVHVPVELSHLKRPVVGFFGAIDDHTFDVQFAADVARRLPQMSFLFIGHPTTEVTALTALPNVHMIGQRAYEEIPAYGALLDVAIMTWHRNRWVDACNPVKLKEYLALGKPVVSTPFRQLEEYRDFVEVAATPQDFALAVQRVLFEDNATRVRARQDRVRGVTWDRVTTEVVDHLRSLTGSRER